MAGLSLRLARLQLCQYLRQVLGGFQLLLFFIDFHQLGHNSVQCNTAVAQCCQQIFICIDANFAACFLQFFRRHQHLRLVAEAFNLTLQHFTALDDIFLTALLLEPAFDFVARIGRADNINPVTARSVGLLGGDNLYDIAVLQLVVKRYNASVDLGTYAAVAYIRMDAVSEVNRHTAYRQVDNISARRKDKDLIGKDIHLDRVHKVTRIIHILVPFQKLTQPAQLGIKALVTARRRLTAAAFLIAPVRSDTVFTDAVHLKGADLDFQRLTAIGKHSRMQGLIHIRFRHRYIVLEAARNRTPHAVYDTQCSIAVLNGVYQHTDGQQIINLAQLLVVTQHFFMDTVKVFRSALNFAADTSLLDSVLQRCHSLVNHILALTAFYFYLLNQVVINIRLHITEGQILQLPFNGIDAKTMCQRRINLQCFPGNRLLLMHRHILHRAHIMQTVSQLNQYNADISCHRQKHFAIVFNLAVFLGNIFDFTQLGNTVYQVCYYGTELLFDIVQLVIRILNHIVQKGCCQGFIVHLQSHKDADNANRMDDVRFTGFTCLRSMRFSCQLIGLTDKSYLLRRKIFFYTRKQFIYISNISYCVC